MKGLKKSHSQKWVNKLEYTDIIIYFFLKRQEINTTVSTISNIFGISVKGIFMKASFSFRFLLYIKFDFKLNNIFMFLRRINLTNIIKVFLKRYKKCNIFVTKVFANE